jgi:epoxyqueuosine reductase
VDLDGYAATLREVAEGNGLHALGFASARPFESTRVVLESRKAQGLHGGMQFTYRNPARSTEPDRALPTVETLVVAARAYSSGRISDPSPRHGRVARYAAGDHYGALRRGLDAVADRLRADGWTARVVLDDNALVDRAAAERAGLGWFGKNANLLLPGVGSYFVLGSVLTDAPLATDGEPVADGCGTCTRCLDGCPTGAIVAPGVLDARRCLAWLLQAEGDFPLEFRAALGDRIYGCDECQEVCPPNRRVDRGGAGQVSQHDAAEVATDDVVDVIALLDAGDAELLAEHGRWYIARRDPRYLRRNALVVLGNIGDRDDPDTRRVLHAYRDGDDAMLAEHATWASTQLGLDAPVVDGSTPEPSLSGFGVAGP